LRDRIFGKWIWKNANHFHWKIIRKSPTENCWLNYLIHLILFSTNDSISLYFTKTNNGRTFLQRWNTVITKHQFFEKYLSLKIKKILLKSSLILKNSVSRFSVQNRLTQCREFSLKKNLFAEKKTFTRFQWKSFIQSSWFDTLNGRKTLKLCHFSFKSQNFLLFFY
jgi:hypothetical protein